MTPAELCDEAVRWIINLDCNAIFVDRHTIATAVRMVTGGPCTAEYASYLLQRHRIEQGYGTTEYVINCQGMARSAVWCIMSGPGCARMDERQQVAMGHFEYVAVDNARKTIRDIIREVNPAVLAHPTVAGFVASAAQQLETNIRTTAAGVHAAVALVEGVTGTTADRDRIPSLNGKP